MPEELTNRKEIMKKLRAKIQEMHEKGLFPKGYGQTIADKLGCTRNRVYKTIRGETADLAIMEELIGMAEETSKEAELLKRANKILK